MHTTTSSHSIAHSLTLFFSCGAHSDHFDITIRVWLLLPIAVYKSKYTSVEAQIIFHFHFHYYDYQIKARRRLHSFIHSTNGRRMAKREKLNEKCLNRMERVKKIETNAKHHNRVRVSESERRESA